MLTQKQFCLLERFRSIYNTGKSNETDEEIWHSIRKVSASYKILFQNYQKGVKLVQ